MEFLTSAKDSSPSLQVMKFKLGRLPVRHDPRTLKLKEYLTTLPPLPAAVDWGSNVKNWQMLGNDSVGDCTCAGAGHAIETWTANASQEFGPTTNQILEAYSAITGYNANDPSTDQGANMIDVLNYWRKVGIAGHQITAYTSVNWAKQTEIMASVYLFGGCYIGVNLPQSAEEAFSNGEPWTDTSDTNILGGHCVLIVGYDSGGLWICTWGRLVYASWAWLNAYTEEAYAVYSRPDWVEATGNCPPGFNDQALESDLAMI